MLPKIKEAKSQTCHMLLYAGVKKWQMAPSAGPHVKHLIESPIVRAIS